MYQTVGPRSAIFPAGLVVIQAGQKGVYQFLQRQRCIERFTSLGIAAIASSASSGSALPDDPCCLPDCSERGPLSCSEGRKNLDTVFLVRLTGVPSGKAQ